MTQAISLLLPAVLTASAGACTVCDSGTGVAVREGITQGFWTNLGLVMAPFLGTFLILAILHLLLPRTSGPEPRSASTHQSPP